MKAMILAAGNETQVGPITNEVPKPMIPILRKPIMESVVELLRAHDVSEIVVNTSHLAPVIENYFRDGSRLGVQIAYSYEGFLTENGLKSKTFGSAGGMKRIQEFSGFFNETFIVLSGDAWIDLDISAALQKHREKGSLATAILQEVPTDEVHQYDVVKLDDDQRIIQFQQRPQADKAASNLVNTGIYIFEPDIFYYIPSDVEYDIDKHLFQALIAAGEQFHGLLADFQWFKLSSIADVWAATRQALHGGIRNFRMPGKQVRPGVWTGINVSINWRQVDIKPPVYIGSSTKIEPGCTITGPCMIGSNCLIEAGAEIADCLISDYTRIGGLASVENKLIFGGDCISPDGSLFNVGETQIRWLVDDIRRTLNSGDLRDMMLFNNMLSFHQVTKPEKEEVA